MRQALHETLSRKLASLSDEALARFLAQAGPYRPSIGGDSASAEFEGSAIFIKRIPLCERERNSTADPFRLPAELHYGIGGPGFGPWRELEAHRRTTAAVLTRECESFPLLHHGRVLPATTPFRFPERDRELMLSHWGEEVRACVEARESAPLRLVLVLEHFPMNAEEWLATQPSRAAVLEKELLGTLRFLRSRGMIHFDAHLRNVVSDGERFYLTDFGLATSPEFELSPDELAFAHRHREYDRDYALMQIANSLARNLFGPAEYDARLRDYANGKTSPSVDPELEAHLLRTAPLAVTLKAFLRKLGAGNLTEPFPARELDRHRSTLHL